MGNGSHRRCGRLVGYIGWWKSYCGKQVEEINKLKRLKEKYVMRFVTGTLLLVHL